MKEAELIKCKSRISGLEAELQTLKTSKQKKQIELEEEIQQMKIERAVRLRLKNQICN